MAAVQGEGLHTAVHDKLRAVAVNSQVVDLIQQYGKDFRIDIVSIRFVIISFNGVLCPKVISPLGKDKRGAGCCLQALIAFCTNGTALMRLSGFKPKSETEIILFAEMLVEQTNNANDKSDFNGKRFFMRFVVY